MALFSTGKGLKMSEKKGILSFLNGAEIKQFISYFFVGGASALVEWISFFLLGRFLNMPYLPATALAFVISTTTNWFLGRTFTFKNSKLGKKKGKEFVQVFGVSAIGLLGNLLLMYIFVDLIGMKTELLKTIAKIVATGIIFIWNYLARKLWIYRQKPEEKE